MTNDKHVSLASRLVWYDSVLCVLLCDLFWMLCGDALDASIHSAGLTTSRPILYCSHLLSRVAVSQDDARSVHIRSFEVLCHLALAVLAVLMDKLMKMNIVIDFKS